MSRRAVDKDEIIHILQHEIELLSQQECDTAIEKNCRKLASNVLDAVRVLIDVYPEIEPEAMISVDDGLPEDDREVLVYTDRYGGKYEFAYYVHHLDAWYSNCCLLIPNVLFWKTLPPRNKEKCHEK